MHTLYHSGLPHSVSFSLISLAKINSLGFRVIFQWVHSQYKTSLNKNKNNLITSSWVYLGLKDSIYSVWYKKYVQNRVILATTYKSNRDKAGSDHEHAAVTIVTSKTTEGWIHSIHIIMNARSTYLQHIWHKHMTFKEDSTRLLHNITVWKQQWTLINLNKLHCNVTRIVNRSKVYQLVTLTLFWPILWNIS